MARVATSGTAGDASVSGASAGGAVPFAGLRSPALAPVAPRAAASAVVVVSDVPGVDVAGASAGVAAGGAPATVPPPPGTQVPCTAPRPCTAVSARPRANPRPVPATPRATPIPLSVTTRAKP